jgi:preprotein translocase subunit YajC
MFASLLMLAEDSAPSWAPALPLIILVPAFFLLVVLPSRRQAKEQQTMLSALKKKDRVLTSAGIIGVVDSIKEKEDEVSLKIDENSPVRLRVTKSSIVRILTVSDEPTKEPKEGSE